MTTATYDDPDFSQVYTITTANVGTAAEQEVAAYAWNREWSVDPVSKYAVTDVAIIRAAELWATAV